MVALIFGIDVERWLPVPLASIITKQGEPPQKTISYYVWKTSFVRYLVEETGRGVHRAAIFGKMGGEAGGVLEGGRGGCTW